MYKYGWWNEQGESAARCLFDEIKIINQNDSPRLNSILRYLRAYTGRDNVNVSTIDVISRLQLKADSSKVVERGLNYNVIQSAINTLHSKICKRREKVRFLTNGGDWESQRQAQKADRFMYGLFMSAKVHEVNMKQTLDSYWSGSGFVQIHHAIKNGKIQLMVDRIHPAEIVVDQSEAETSDPRTMRRVRAVDKELLKRRFPEIESRIDLLEMKQSGGYDALSGKVLVAESWHLPDDKGEGGKHIIAIENAVLHEEPYSEYHFPIVKQDYLWAPFGYYGIGIAELLTTHQRELDALVEYRQQCLKRGANPRTYVERSSKVSPNQLTNSPNTIVEYTGVRPVQEVAPPYADTLARDIEDIFQKAYQEVGISQLSASSQKPAGLNSGKALREYSDIETERFQIAGQNRQHAHLDIARAIIREVKRINELIKSVPEYKSADKSFMSYDKERGLEKFNLTELELLEDEYIIQMHNTSMFPNKPEGQLEFAQELAAAGLIDQQEALELLDFPDTSAVINRNLAGNRYSRQAIERMLDEGVYVAPDPYEDHGKNYQVAQKYYLQAKLRGYDESKLSLLRRYMDANIAQIQRKQAEMQAAQMAMQPQPMQPQQQAMGQEGTI